MISGLFDFLLKTLIGNIQPIVFGLAILIICFRLVSDLPFINVTIPKWMLNFVINIMLLICVIFIIQQYYYIDGTPPVIETNKEFDLFNPDTW